MLLQFIKSINTVKAFQLFHVFRFGVSILVGILLVKSGYTTEVVSQYEYFLFLAALVSFFWVNGLLKSMMALYSSYDETKKKELLTNTAVLVLGFGIVVVILGWFINILFLHLSLLTFLLVGLFVLFSSIGAMGELILVLQDKAFVLLKYGAIIFGLQFVLMLLAILNFDDIENVLLVLVIWSFLRMGYSLIVLRRYGSRRVRWVNMISILVFAFPLIGESLMGNAMEYVDGSLVKYFFDESMFGIYRIGAKELPFSSLFIMAIGTAVLPVMVSGLDKGLGQMKQELNDVMKWLYPLSIVLMLLSPWLFTTVYSEEYMMSAQVFNIYLLIVVSRVLMPQVVLLSFYKNYFLFVVSILELVINLSLSVFLMSTIGLLGIPIASLIAFMVNKLILVFYLQRKYDIPLHSYLDMKKYFGYSFILFVSYFVSMMIH